MSAAGLDTTESADKIKQWQGTQKDFLRQTGLKRQGAREQIAGFGKSEARKASAAAEEYYRVWSKSTGVNDAIKTLANYYDVKYTNSPRYELLKLYAEDVKNGWISPLSGFSNYEALYNRVQTEIVGTTTANGILIQGQSRHFMQRVIGTMVDPEKLKTDLKVIRRAGVEIEDIKSALRSPVKIGDARASKNGKVSVKFTGAHCQVSVNPEDGTLIQTNPQKE